jgi:hypothetical protein
MELLSSSESYIQQHFSWDIIYSNYKKKKKKTLI